MLAVHSAGMEEVQEASELLHVGAPAAGEVEGAADAHFLGGFGVDVGEIRFFVGCEDELGALRGAKAAAVYLQRAVAR